MLILYIKSILAIKFLFLYKIYIFFNIFMKLYYTLYIFFIKIINNI